MTQECAEYERLLAKMHEEFPRFKVIAKAESPFQKLIHSALVVVTLGQMRSYLSSYHTTLGQRLYVCEGWEQKSKADRFILLAHERIHMLQFQRFSWPGMTLLYLLVPLPMGLAYFRARFEKEAYAETIRAAGQIYGSAHVRDPHFREHIVSQFLSASYGWMWPFRASIERWYEGILLEAGL